jgi:hypothetical protein
VSIVALLLAIPSFSPGLREAVEATIVWDYVGRLQTMVVAVSAIMCIFIIWTQRPKHGHHAEEGKKHH